MKLVNEILKRPFQPRPNNQFHMILIKSAEIRLIFCRPKDSLHESKRLRKGLLKVIFYAEIANGISNVLTGRDENVRRNWWNYVSLVTLNPVKSVFRSLDEPILNIFLFFFFSYRHNQSIQSVRTQTVKRTPAPSRTRQSVIVISLPTVQRSRVVNDKKPPVQITFYSSQSLTQFIPLRW